jgi:drug/metabolite transporter (DMT)-like permease
VKPVLFAICAMLCYATANVLYELRLSKVNNIVVLCGWYAAMLPVALVILMGLRLGKTPVVWPGREHIPMIILTAVIWFIADSFFTGAYTSGGTLITVTSITIMFPAFAALIKYYASGHTPNWYQISGYLLAVGAVMLILKGSELAHN